MLYLFAREAEKRGVCKLPMASIYKIMVKLESDFEDLNIPITFEKIGTDVQSRRIDEAMFGLINLDLEIVNPSFSIKLERDAAIRRLRKLDSRLSGPVKGKLELMFKKFDGTLNSSKR